MRQNEQKTFRKRNTILTFILLLVILILIFILGSVIQKKYQKRYAVISKDEADISAADSSADETAEEEPTIELYLGDDEYATTHRMESYLFMGTDASGNPDASGEDYHGAMADFLLLAVIDHTDESYGFLQINRDTMTEITLLQPDGGNYASAELQLCTAHWYGGDAKSSCENVVEAVSSLLGELPIDGYYALDMQAIPKINHAVGGIEVTIEDDFSQSDPSLVQGTTVLLNDEQAYHYIHDRINVGDGENVSRMQRQKNYMDAMFEKVRDLQSKDQQFILQMLNDLKDVAVTDMDLNKLAKSMQKVSHYQSTGVYQIEGKTKLGQALGDGLDHTEFYPDETDKQKKLIQLYHLQKIEDDEEEE